MLLPLSECAELAGISRSGLMKAIKRGRLTATKDERTGQWAIDSAELSRVYTLKSPGDTALPPNDTQSDVLAEQLRSAESMIDALKNERDYLRRRIDADSESIRTLSALLTDARKDSDKSVIPVTPSARVGLYWVAIVILAALCVGLGVFAWLKAV